MGGRGMLLVDISGQEWEVAGRSSLVVSIWGNFKIGEAGREQDRAKSFP